MYITTVCWKITGEVGIHASHFAKPGLTESYVMQGHIVVIVVPEHKYGPVTKH